MFSTRTIALVGALVMASATAARAQEIDMTPPSPATPAAAGGDDAFHKGTLGFAFPFTLVSNVAGSIAGTSDRVSTVDIVYFLNDKAALDLIVGLNFHRKQVADVTGTVDNNLFGFAAGVGYRLYSSKNNLRSFIEPQAVLLWPNTSDSNSFAVNLGAAMGVERNLTPWFSITGAIGAALDFTNSFKEIQVATTANLAANLYWR